MSSSLPKNVRTSLSLQSSEQLLMCLELSTCLSPLIAVCAGNELCASLFNGLVVSAVYLVPLRWFGKVCGKHVMRPWESMALCQPNQPHSNTLLLHSGHNDGFLSAWHFVSALCLSGTTLCVGFQTSDLMSFCTVGWVLYFFEMPKILFYFLTVSLSFLSVISHVVLLVRCSLHFLKTVS